jgi:NADH:ubiquinone oxidoreductase subunit E
MKSDQSFLIEIIKKIQEIQSNTIDEDTIHEITELLEFIEQVI